ncbi:MAG: hypothetical protein Q8K93_07620 [Reyranella sp.]|uniref:hypothetical protein n=1 Tax=Reyranella sp. TaxID=1929291 RepID=UPI0027303FF0|nr:hypothetical protein [Reyranella sp.]MDP1962052.1 hypothetical protein [Reyranella sp.]MDP2374107.1 hypothetical protein [Reyranella sp.]
MTLKFLLAASVLIVAATAAQAQVAPTNFDQAAYITCREAQAMQPAVRQQLAVYLADHAARHRGVAVPEDERGAQLAHLVRGGCTLAPDAYLFTVIDRALVAELAKLPKRK